MRVLLKNKRVIYYQNILETVDEVVDGFKTGNKIPIYEEPVRYLLTTSFPIGNNDVDMAGILSKYDKIGIDSKESIHHIKEQARIFIDKVPEINESGEYDNWNYICDEVLNSLNQVIYGFSKRV